MSTATPSTSSPPGSPHPLDPRRWGAASFVLMAIAMDILDTTIVIIALPAIEEDLGANSATLQWVTAAYTLTFALTLVTAGRIGDILGRRRTLLAGIAGFVATSAMCALAPTAEILVAGRVLQAVAGSLILTQGLSIFQVEFRGDERRAILGIFGAVLGSAAVLGPILGGFLVEADLWGLGWRTIFWINLPIGVVALAGASRYVRESRSDRPASLDLGGLALLTVALFALLFPMVQGRELGWPLWSIVLMVAGAALLLVFARSQVVRDRAGREPLVVPRLWRERSFVSGLGVVLGFLAAFTSLFFVVTYYLQVGLGFSPLTSGLSLVPSALSTVVFSLLSTPLLRRFGARVLTAGAIAGALGLVLLLIAVQVGGASLAPIAIAPAMVVIGAGIGLVTAPVIDVVLARVPTSEAGSASGVLNTAEQLGSALGVAVVGTAFFQIAGEFVDDQPVLADALSGALWICVALMLVSAGLSLLLPRSSTAEPSAA